MVSCACRVHGSLDQGQHKLWGDGSEHGPPPGVAFRGNAPPGDLGLNLDVPGGILGEFVVG